MKFLSVILIGIITIFLIQACSSSTETKEKVDGTITVKLTGAATEANGKHAFFSVWPAGTDITTITPADYEEKMEGGNFFTITNGTGEGSVFDMSTYQVKKFKGGTKHDIQLFIDMNDNIDITQEVDLTDSSIIEGAMMTNPLAPPSVTIDGNMTVTVNYEDLILINN